MTKEIESLDKKKKPRTEFELLREMFELLKEIKNFSFNYHCNCKSCTKIREKIDEVLNDK
jgi:hypothetical protein